MKVSLTIPIPSDSVIITKVELEQLKRNELTGVYWSMKDLEQRTKKGRIWLQENILYKPRFKNELDSLNGGFVYYPQNQGQTWSFQAVKMAAFLDKNFHLIFN